MPGRLLFSTTADGAATPTERLRIKSDGDVFIGNISNANDGGVVSSYLTLTLADNTKGAQLHLRGQSPKLFMDVTSGGTAEIYYDSGDFTISSGEPGGGGGTERLRIKSDGNVIIGSGGAWSYPKALNVQGASGSILSLYNADTTSYAQDTSSSIEFKLLTGNTGNQTGSCELRAFKENGTNGNNARGLSFWTGGNGGGNAERIRITSGGTAIFKAGLAEKYENAGTTLGSQPNNPLSDGNVILFTGNESGNKTINFTGVHATLSNGETVSFTAIITPNSSGVINVVQVDGQAITVKWSGGSAPSAGSSGQDIYQFQILKTGTGTSDYTVYGAAANYA